MESRVRSHPGRNIPPLSFALAVLAILAVVGGGAWLLGRQLGWVGTGAARQMSPPEADLSNAHPLLKKTIDRERAVVVANLDSAADWGQLAMRWMAHHFVDEAIACFQQAERLDGGDYRWPYYRGVLLEETDHEKALAALARAASIDGVPAAVKLRFAKALLRANRTKEAERVFAAVGDLNGQAATGDASLVALAAEIGLGRTKLAQGDIGGARERFSRAAKAAPWSREAQRELARASARMADWEAARAAQFQADRLPPGPSEPTDEALAAVEELELLSRRLAMQADEAIGEQDWANAEKSLAAMAKERPELARPRLYLAQIYLSQGRLRQAIDVYVAAVQDFPNDAMARYQLALALEAAGDDAGALARYEQCLALKPDYAEAHFGRGLLLEKRDRRSEAIDAYRRATEASPGFASAHLALGAAIAKEENARAALPHVGRAVQLAPADPASRQLLDRLTKEVAP